MPLVYMYSCLFNELLVSLVTLKLNGVMSYYILFKVTLVLE